MKPEQIPTKAKDMFCYGVYTASHVINHAYAPFLKKLGLTYPQYITLTLLWEKDGRKVSELAQELRMGTNTLTPLLTRMENQGLVLRRSGRRDRREVFIDLGEHGKALQAAAPDITACMISGTSLSFAELNDLGRLLAKLCDGLSSDFA